MAAAVAEAHRVLRPGGLLLDLHPESAGPVLEVWPAGAPHQPLGLLDLDPGDAREFAAASGAVQPAPPGFALAAAQVFDYRYDFDSLDDLTDYLDDNPEFARASDALLEQAALALDRSPAPARLVLLQRVAVTGLRKC